jgi:hypothetical protein
MHEPHRDDPVQRARVYAALVGLPGVVEKTSHGSPSFRTGRDKSDRMFASFVVDHHHDGRIAVWCAAPPGTQALLAETAPERSFVPPYVGKSGWIGLDLLKTDDDQLAHHLRVAWRWVAPKKRLAAIER